jgi:hypothetical protein
MLRAIDIRTHNQYAIEAGLHGIKIPFKYNQVRIADQQKLEDISFDPAIAEKAIMEAQRRVKARYV